MDDFRIVFDKQSKVFSPGDKITGQVIIGTIDDFSFEGLDLKFLGGATIFSTIKHNKNYDGSEVYFDDMLVLSGPDILVPGERSFTFKYKLPNRPLPRALEGIHGKILYEVEAVLKRSTLLKHNVHVKEHIRIITTVDLNHFPDAGEVGEATVTWSMPVCWCCFCCSGKNRDVTLTVMTPFKGSCPGRMIPFKVLVENRNSSDLKDVRADLIQKWVFWCSANTRRMHVTVNSVSRNADVQGKSDVVWRDSIRVPPDLFQPTQGEDMSKIINVTYALRITPVTGRCSAMGSYWCEIPIYVGDVPLPRVSSMSTAIKSQPEVGASEDDIAASRGGSGEHI